MIGSEGRGGGAHMRSEENRTGFLYELDLYRKFCKLVSFPAGAFAATGLGEAGCENEA